MDFGRKRKVKKMGYEHSTVEPIINAGIHRLRYLECQIWDITLPEESIPVSDERSVIWSIYCAMKAEDK